MTNPQPPPPSPPTADQPGPSVWRVLDLLRWTTGHFARKGLETPRLDAECLLAHALDCDRLRLYLDYDKPVGKSERGRFRALVRARAGERRPVALLTGQREFWSLSLRIRPGVFVPRPETEGVVEAALALLPQTDSRARVLEIGTGSGAIALALARERPELQLTATDLCPTALATAQDNAEQLGLAHRIEWCEGELFAPVAERRFDLVVSNPPYLPRRDADALPPELAHEPARALFGGQDGSELSSSLLEAAPAFLHPGGALVIETDPRHIAALRDVWVQAGHGEPQLRRDLAGRPRVMVAPLGPAPAPDSAPPPTPEPA